MILSILCLVVRGMEGASPGAGLASLGAGLERYVRTSWAHQDGLPSTLIYAITQTRDGYLWLGTSDGLIRFDGINFVPQKLLSSSEPLLGAVTALCAAKDGSLWIGSASGFITRMSKIGLRKYRLGAEAEAIVSVSESEVWVIAENGLYRFADVSRGSLTPVERIDPEQVIRRLSLGNGNIPIAPHTTAGEVQAPPIYTHRVLLGGRQLFLNEGKQGKIWLAAQPLPQAVIPSVSLRDTRGYLWAGSLTSGLVRTTNTGRKLEMELASDLIESLFEDREGDIWVGTNNGLHCYRFGKFSLLTKRDGLISDKVTSVEANGHAVWVGTQAGLNLIHDASVDQYLRGVDILSVKDARGGQLWVGTTRGVFKIAAKAAGVLNTQQITGVLTSVTAIEEDAEGGIWLADAQKGLFYWKSGVLTRAEPKLGGNARTIKTIRAQSNGALWLGFFGGGLGVYRQRSFYEFFAADHAPEETVNDVYGQSPEEVWFGTDNGLFRFDGKKFVSWNTDAGLPGNRILWLRADGKDYFWLGFSTGIARVHRSDLSITGPIPSHRVQCDFYDFGDGLPANPVRRSQSAGSLDLDGKLWFTTSAGIAILDSRHIEKNSLQPPVVIERVVADNHEAPIDRAMRFPPLTKNLQIDYAGLSLVVPRKVQFRYRLDGYDKEWQNAGTRRQAFYTNLRPGAYRFQVSAANNDGLWNEDGAGIAFSILPAFYQTRLFAILCVLAAGVIAWGIYRLRLQRMQAAWNARFEERLAERTRIAQDLHDELLQNAMGVSLQIELSDSLIEERHAAKPHLQRALTLSRGLMLKGREVLRDLREKPRDAADIARVLRKAMEDFQREGGPVSNLTVEGTPRIVNPLVADDLTQIGYQAIANAFQHAAAGKIEVRMIYRPSELCLEVKDDGCGIESRVAETGKPGHYGLIGMRERANQIGGTIDIESRTGEGTRVTVIVPGKRAFSREKEK
jgi:signal transduction histidine kinase/ligand-binding sensor domain-containing protein